MFWEENESIEMNQTNICCKLTWDQQLQNKQKAEKILNECSKDELIDYILFNGKQLITVF